ncbi:MAG: COX15/CtaA family protein [Novosphingobium sp.]
MSEVVISPEQAPSRAIPAGQLALLSRWLWLVAAIIVTVVAVGGITRLTESGLSITEWKPVTGVVPPLNEAQWNAEFEAYKQIPQYTQVNGPAGMTLEDYKFIYFWEWFHRFLVRTVLGTAFVLPLIWFWVRGQIPAGYKPRLLGLLALGGLQAVVGWWMVKSGLTGDADVKVSHFRLAAHLLVALFTLTYTVWTALDFHALSRGQKPARLTGFGVFAIAALFLQLFLGALVAGLRAGHVANDWPLMMGRFWPDGIDWTGGPVHALLNDPFLLHFLHRWWAWGVVAVLVVLARRIRTRCRAASIAIHSAFGTQVILGIVTVMTGVALWLAVLHQLVGALLVASTAWGAHVLGRQE